MIDLYAWLVISRWTILCDDYVHLNDDQKRREFSFRMNALVETGSRMNALAKQ